MYYWNNLESGNGSNLTDLLLKKWKKNSSNNMIKSNNNIFVIEYDNLVNSNK